MTLHIPKLHLFRGAPAVRSWSRNQETDKAWTLCGMHRSGPARPLHATEDADLVTCHYCQLLMRAGQDVATGAPQ